jgi:hypothetical protein
VSKFGGWPRPQNGVSPTFHKRNLPSVETERSRPSARECREIAQWSAWFYQADFPPINFHHKTIAGWSFLPSLTIHAVGRIMLFFIRIQSKAGLIKATTDILRSLWPSAKVTHAKCVPQSIFCPLTRWFYDCLCRTQGWEAAIITTALTTTCRMPFNPSVSVINHLFHQMVRGRPNVSMSFLCHPEHILFLNEFRPMCCALFAKVEMRS